MGQENLLFPCPPELAWDCFPEAYAQAPSMSNLYPSARILTLQISAFCHEYDASHLHLYFGTGQSHFK